MKSARQVLADAGALDARRQNQINNQVASINRLLKDGSYDTEMGKLHTELAEAQAALSEAESELQRLREAKG